jgi:NAD(P)-dependent dehydrogenase (short-subunit alcohol dehydrogenase family)
LVTGGGSGIGRAASLLFAERGAQVAVVDRDGDAADRVVSEIVEAGGEAVSIPADISREADTKRMVSDAVDRFSRLDYLFANAGIHRTGSVVSTTIDSWDEVLGVNLRGSFLSSRACIPHLLEAGGGAIVITSSDSAVQTAADEAAYTTAKHALIGLARSIAVDFGPEGIRANVLIPGVTNTPGLHEIFSSGGRSPDSEIRHAAALSPLRRVGEPREVAEVAAFLCSDRASFITGAAILVDGGMTIAYPAD